MEKNNPYVRQEASWLSCLLAVWLLVALQGRTTVPKSITDRQAYLSFTSSGQDSDESDYSPSEYVHTQAALFHATPGFAFPTPAGFLPSYRYHFASAWSVSVLTVRQKPYFIFGLLHLIFEHQIAINAP